MSNTANAPHHHILPLKIYITIGAILLFLTFVTWWVAHFDFGPLNMIIAMLIALVKATLVVMYFMHLKYDSKVYLSVFLLALLMLATFIIFTMLDTERRGEVDRVTKYPIQSQAEFYDSLPKSSAHGVVGGHNETPAVMGDTLTKHAADSGTAHTDTTHATDSATVQPSGDGH